MGIAPIKVLYHNNNNDNNNNNNNINNNNNNSSYYFNNNNNNNNNNKKPKNKTKNNNNSNSNSYYYHGGGNYYYYLQQLPQPQSKSDCGWKKSETPNINYPKKQRNILQRCQCGTRTGRFLQKEKKKGHIVRWNIHSDLDACAMSPNQMSVVEEDRQGRRLFCF